jgi:SAM-dependent methyltransferase
MLADTQAAFDSVADVYDGPRGNNSLIQRMRELSWRVIADLAPAPARLLDLGCGTGIDALHFAQAGCDVMATDWSPQMVQRAAARAQQLAPPGRLDARRIGAHELQLLEVPADGRFDAAYSNFGPLNCVPDLRQVSQHCARVLKPRGHLIFSVIGRVCPWEFFYYLTRGRPQRALVRFTRCMTAVNLNRHKVWTRYYTPLEFYRHFAPEFELVSRRALSLFLPPPYLIDYYEHYPRCSRIWSWLDDHLGSAPVLRGAGDHFLIVMRRRASLSYGLPA